MMHSHDLSCAHSDQEKKLFFIFKDKNTFCMYSETPRLEPPMIVMIEVLLLWWSKNSE